MDSVSGLRVQLDLTARDSGMIICQSNVESIERRDWCVGSEGIEPLVSTT